MGHATSCAAFVEMERSVPFVGQTDRGELMLLASIESEHAGQPIEAREHARAAQPNWPRESVPTL